METTIINGVRCPKCGGFQVICTKRGYSFLWGLVGAVLTLMVYIIMWIEATGYAQATTEEQDAIFAAGGGFFLAFLLGFLWGFAGKNKLVYVCAACGKRFDSFDINEKGNKKFNKVIYITLGVVAFLLVVFLLIGA